MRAASLGDAEARADAAELNQVMALLEDGRDAAALSTARKRAAYQAYGRRVGSQRDA